jgi:hypothetical protein
MTSYEPKLVMSRRWIKSSSVDPMELEAWTLAAAIAWIRVRHLPEAERSARVRDAYHYEFWAFPADEHLPNVEGRLLMDQAIKGNLKLHCSDGEIAVAHFGPNSEILPTGSDLELCIFPKFKGTWHTPANGRTITGVWCHRTQVQKLWPAEDRVAGLPIEAIRRGDDIRPEEFRVSADDLSLIPAVARPGRYEKQDAPLRREIIQMVVGGSAPTVEDAARQLAFAERIFGKGTLENKATRLAKQVLEIRPDLSTRKKSEQTLS